MSFDEPLDAEAESIAAPQNPFSMVELWMRVHGMTLAEVKHAAVSDHVFSVYGDDRQRPMFSIPFETAAQAKQAHAVLLKEIDDMDRELSRHFVFRG